MIIINTIPDELFLFALVAWSMDIKGAGLIWMYSLFRGSDTPVAILGFVLLFQYIYIFIREWRSYIHPVHALTTLRPAAFERSYPTKGFIQIRNIYWPVVLEKSKRTFLAGRDVPTTVFSYRPKGRMFAIENWTVIEHRPRGKYDFYATTSQQFEMVFESEPNIKFDHRKDSIMFFVDSNEHREACDYFVQTASGISYKELKRQVPELFWTYPSNIIRQLFFYYGRLR